MTSPLRAVAAEAFGTAALLVAVVGSGIMAAALSPQSEAIALLANALATGFALYVLITILAPVSGAHLNPVVSVTAWLRRDIRAPTAVFYIASQCAGGLAGVLVAHLMFDLAPLQVGMKNRTGTGQWLGEFVATGGLMMVIAGVRRHAPHQSAVAIASYIAAAYWFTASTSFANPAVTLSRAMTATFAGISPADAPAFVLAQFAGAAAAWPLARWLFDAERTPGR